MLRLIVLLLFVLPFSSFAATVRVAVASNFAATLDKIGIEFERQTGHQIKSSSGASAKLAAQIRQGAPFDVFLSADEVQPAALLRDGIGVASSRFSYAIGQLVLWSKTRRDVGSAALQQGHFNKLAIANPDSAPYGRAAMQTLQSLQLQSKLQNKLLFGENISQTLQFAQLGGAEFAFVSIAQLREQAIQQYLWLVPEKLHQPIRQDALLIKDSVAARALIAFLRGETAHQLLLQAGYRLRACSRSSK
ncbi:molybdate ABC transporter substrate-binding protein [Neisseriaceae bacterium TC5R-5]|nr:molybdate ABC transporter substrate-binding protein [Neisseriaceae bacterium TC5R-5]